jgi:signal transduction histidine kinase
MRLGLRWKILLLTALPLAALTSASLWLVDRGVSSRASAALRDDLVRAGDLLESMIAERTERLEATGAVIVRDPRFFSMLTLPHARGDAQFKATVAGVASDFEALAHPDVFEVVDGHGDVVASVGNLALDPAARTALAAGGLEGRTERRAVAVRGTHVLLVSTPIVADRRVVGTLLLGTEVGGALAGDLRQLTKSDVTFLSGGRVTRSTLDRPEDRGVAITAATGGGSDPRTIRSAAARWIALARPLPFSTEGGGQAFVVQRSFDAETAFLRDVRSHLAELGLLAILGLTLAGLLIATRLTRPIRQLVDAAEAMERGRWDAPIETGRGDELGALANRFDQMRRRQRVYVEHLEDVARAKSEFIAVASHELRTPIAIVMGWRDLLATGQILPPDARFERGIEAIGNACATLERIAVDATRMADAQDAGDAVDAEWCELGPLLERVLRDVREGAAARVVALVLDVDPAAARAWADPAQLARAVDALVSNGVRFTPDGGTVHIEARAEGAALLVHVRDSGIGLTAEARARLAERTIAPRDSGHHHTGRGLAFNHQGLGFGLALARRIVEAHGGELRIEGEEGRGSAFTLFLPDALAPGAHREAA